MFQSSSRGPASEQLCVRVPPGWIGGEKVYFSSKGVLDGVFMLQRAKTWLYRAEGASGLVDSEVKKEEDDRPLEHHQPGHHPPVPVSTGRNGARPQLLLEPLGWDCTTFMVLMVSLETHTGLIWREDAADQLPAVCTCRVGPAPVAPTML